jgi:hypothetical protein
MNAIKTHGGRGSTAPLFFTSALGVFGQLHASTDLPPEKQPPLYPLDRGLGGPQSRSGHRGAEKNSATPPGNLTPAVQAVARYYTD